MARYAELFAGAGGLSIGLERAGFECAWHAELADFPRRILKHRWPHTPLLGDVTQLDGRELVRKYGAIDVLSGGSPCQDLSVAGRREGLTGKRSILFYEQMRLWDETEAPVCLWENVDGARSSNEGKDLAAVLSAFVGATVTVPAGGWGSAGVVAGSTAVAAFRLLDAQYFGVAQRRVRIIIIGSRDPRIDPAEILLESESLRRYSAPRRRPQNRVTKTTRAGAPKTSIYDARGNGDGALAPTLAGDHQSRVTDYTAIIAFSAEDDGCDATVNLSPPLRASSGGTMPAVIAFDEAQVTHPANRSNPQPSDPAPTFADPSRLIAVYNETGHERWQQENIVGTINAHEHKDAHTIVGTPEARSAGGFLSTTSAQAGHLLPTNGIPRRLMPIECERLMGWPDDWTNVPDEKGKPAADGPRYKAIGNGVASPMVQWIGERLLPCFK